MDLIETLFGIDADLNFAQMSARAATIFIIALVLIRLSGRRSFGLHSPFDSCTTVLLGAILSRAVTGSSPYWSTVAAATTLVLMHRAFGRASLFSSGFERLVNGRERILVSDGRPDHGELRKALVTTKDLDEAIRRKLGHGKIELVAMAVLERNGEITVIGRDDGPHGYVQGSRAPAP